MSFDLHHLHAFNNFFPIPLCLQYTVEPEKMLFMLFILVPLTQDSLLYLKGAMVWNGIPLEIRVCTTCDSFKLQYKKYLLSLQSEA